MHNHIEIMTLVGVLNHRLMQQEYNQEAQYLLMMLLAEEGKGKRYHLYLAKIQKK